MITLRLVGSSADLKHLVFTSKKTGRKGSHLVAVDDKLFDVLEDLVRRRRRAGRDSDGNGNGAPAAPVRKAAPAVDSKLAPRDVQRLLRAGRSPEQVARTANAPLAWVEQFVVPVLYEQQGMIRECRRATFEKPRQGPSGIPLGESVLANLRTRHIRMTDKEFEDCWSATRAEGQPWTVVLRFRFRGREQRAIWRYDPAGRLITAGNRLASDLGWVAPGRKVAPAKGAARRGVFVSGRGAAAEERPAAPSRRRPAGKKKPATKKKSAARRPAPKRPAKKRPAKKRSVARRPAKRRVAKRRVAKKRSVARRPAKKRAAKKRTGTVTRTRSAVKRRPAKRRPARRTTRRR